MSSSCTQDILVVCLLPMFKCTARCTRANPNATGTGKGLLMKRLHWLGSGTRASMSLVQAVCAVMTDIRKEMAIGDESCQAFLEVLLGVWLVAAQVRCTVWPAWLSYYVLYTALCSPQRTDAIAPVS